MNAKREFSTSFIDDHSIQNLLRKQVACDQIQVKKILTKARKLKGLDLDEVAVLMKIEDKNLLEQLFNTAKEVKEEIYGNRIVLFAPLYISNLCRNECTYCAFRAANKDVRRKALRQEEINSDVERLIEQGHKRILMVAGESYPKDGFDYILDSLKTIYKAKSGKGEIRRVNVNLAPLTVSQYSQLKEIGIGTYQIFQETYHRETYAKVHLSGMKKNYDWRLTAPDRAMKAGIDDIGIGVLFGLYDWKFEMLALLKHVKHLEDTFGVGPHTISVPRLEPAIGSDIASKPPYEVSDQDFKKIVAILRLVVPYTGLIMSTRENAKMRRETLELGISQISAGSQTNPGGYSENKADANNASQFQLGDHRSLDEVIGELSKNGFIPSFCTGCYRLGRTGQDFMDMAKPGLIKKFCQPNAIFTFKEYLEDYASENTKQLGEELIIKTTEQMGDDLKKRCDDKLQKISSGERDIFV